MLLQVREAFVGQGRAIVLSMVCRTHVDDLDGDSLTRRNGASTGERAVVEGAVVSHLIASGGTTVIARRTAGSLVACYVCGSAAILRGHRVCFGPRGTESFADVFGKVTCGGAPDCQGSGSS